MITVFFVFFILSALVLIGFLIYTIENPDDDFSYLESFKKKMDKKKKDGEYGDES